MHSHTRTAFLLVLFLLSFVLFETRTAEAAPNTVGVGGTCTIDECLTGLTCKAIPALSTDKKCIRPQNTKVAPPRGTGRTGEPCAVPNDCASALCTSNICQPAARDSIPMGFACDKSADCLMGLSQVMPLCDESKNAIDGGNICKGNASDTGCALDPENWCVFGITCNEQTSTCVNDFGAESTRKLRLGEDTTDIKIQINRVINILLSFLAIIGVILIVYAGILWATAGGNDEQVGKARKTMIAAAIGLLIIGVAWTIISFVISLGGTIS